MTPRTDRLNRLRRRFPDNFEGEWIDQASTRVKRGKFEGYLLADVHGPYLVWLLFNADNLSQAERLVIEARLNLAPIHCTTVAEIRDPMMVAYRAGRLLNAGGSDIAQRGGVS
ncbi:MAG: hypothetical protein NTX57_05805 [Armatimonadetes bacterium]|nr:hypothetical protein [Armatimonadota bacterium]